jgi:chaperonin cofactor prefoldin
MYYNASRSITELDEELKKLHEIVDILQRQNKVLEKKMAQLEDNICPGVKDPITGARHINNPIILRK